MRLKSKVLLSLTIFLSLLALQNCQQTEEEKLCNQCGYGGTAILDDQLIISFNTHWKSVCDNNFSDVAADVACKSVYGEGSTQLSWSGNQECKTSQFWLDSVECGGTEDNLFNCDHLGIGTHKCSETQCIALSCSKPTDTVVNVQLVLGILQVQYNDEWRYVCDDDFTVNEADVACRSIYGSNYQTENLYLEQNCEGLDTLNFWLDDVVCTGSESNIAQCSYPGWGYHNCYADECIRLSCEEIPVREISNLVHSENGILNVQYKGELKAVCDDTWAETASAVACTELYGNPAFYSFETNQPCNTQDFWLDDVECSGTELKIEECDHLPFGEHDCQVVDDECIRLYCVLGGPQPPVVPPPPTDGKLVQNQTSGVLSFNYQDSVNAICHDNFDHQGAMVACQELYNNPTVVRFATDQQCDKNEFWLDNVMCGGQETAIRNCPHTGFRNYQECDPLYECVAVWCAGGGPTYRESTSPPPRPPKPPVEGPAVLSQSNEGILSILYNEERKSVCDDGFGDEEAAVACFELYGTTDVISYETNKQCDYEEFWIDLVVCTGTEATIQQCQHNAMGEHDCRPYQCVKLFCRGGGPQPQSEVLMHQGGQLQILRDGEVKSVCQHQFNEYAAASACFSMYGTYEVLSFTLDQSCLYTDFWVDNIVCSAQQPTLTACPHDAFGTAVCNQNECVLLYCKDIGPQPDVQIVGFAEHDQISAILNYNYNGESKAVCDDEWTQLESEVACQELYQNSTVIYFKIGQKCDYETFWLDDVVCESGEQKLEDCVHLPYGQHDCNPMHECIQLFCAGGGPQPPESIQSVKIGEVKSTTQSVKIDDVKLTQSLTGVISLTVDGVAGNICHKGFDMVEANVACQELYEVDAESYSIGLSCPYDNFWINDLDCQGTEKNLQACSRQHEQCGSSECVAVFCQGEGPSSGVILVQSETGILQIKRNEAIANVCDDAFNSYAAEIACQELFQVSYTSFNSAQCDGEDAPFWLDEVQCAGHEQRLTDCPHLPWGEHDCGDTECIRLVCNGEGYQDIEPPVVLIHNQISGVLSISRGDVPQGVCDDGFSQAEAEVACFELYGNSEVLFYQHEAHCDHTGFWLDDVVCDGEETAIKDCSHLSWGQHNCNSEQCIQLFCAGGGPCYDCAPPSPEEVPRLKVNSNGVLQIVYQGETRAVCDDNFTSTAGEVACRELYGADSLVVQLKVEQSCVDEDFWLDEVVCDGEETTIFDCQHNELDDHDCVAEDDECIQLFCTGGGPEPDTAPLVHGSSGILNILYNGEVKAVCDDGFSVFNAETACKELYNNPEVIEFKINQVCDYQEFWLDDVDCTEQGSKLTLCQHAPFGQSDCNAVDDECIYLKCAGQPVNQDTPITPIPISNILIHNQTTGVLSISKDGDFRAICDHIWTDLNAAVACNQLYSSPSFESYNTNVECDYQQFWLDQVDCSGSESRIEQCSNAGWGVNDCHPSYECVQLFCTAGGPQAPSGELWQNPVTGVISITYERETKGLCHDGFNKKAAEVICQELYNNPSVETYFTQQRCDFQDFWLDDVVCTGSESKIDVCEHKPYGTHNCDYLSECVRVYCTGGGPQLPPGVLVHTQTGMLAIQYDQQVKSLADSGFGDEEARTSCTELYGNPHFISYKTGEACAVEGFWLDNVVCTESNTNIDSCQHTNYGEVSERTTSSSCVELFCLAGGPEPPKGYLSHTNTTGILNIRYEDSIKSVCHNRFDDQDAEVACKELYGSKVFISFQSGQACENPDFWIDNIECNGSEEFINDCPHVLWGQVNCNPLNACVRLYCQAGGPQPEVPPPVLEHSSTGILSITYNGETRALCDDLFDDLSAAVSCQELYGSPAFLSYQFNQICDYPTYWINDFQCLGTELNLAGCKQTHTVDNNCNEQDCVQLFCSGNGPQQVFVQFVHDPTTAIIQVDKDGILKGICDDGFLQESAQVFCQSLYNDPTVIQYSQGHNCGASITDFWLDDVHCEGDEPNLGKCTHLNWGVHNCNPLFECVQVYCDGGGPQPPAHLTQSLQGILSITYLGVSKAVCDENFNDQSAQVSCSELFGAPEVISYSHGHPCVYEDHWLSNIVCIGGEAKLQDCHHNPWGDACPTNTCVKLFCFAGGQQPVTGRVVHSNTTGILSFTHETVTKAICDDYFGQEEAQIACYELYANSEVISYSQGQNCEQDEFWLDNVQCSGTERLLGECVHAPYGEHDCNPRTQCIKLVCAGGGYRDVVEVPLLHHGTDASLNVVYLGESRSVCDNDFNDFSANVACQQLYGDPVFLRWSGQNDCTHPSFWLDNVRCIGDELSLFDCNHSPLGESNCDTNQCIKLYCRNGGPKVDASPLIHAYNGILSIMHDGSIKGVCDNPFNEISASVACRELYSNPKVLSFTLNQQCNEKDFWLENVECNGGETRMVDCKHDLWGGQGQVETQGTTQMTVQSLLINTCNDLRDCVRLSCEGGGWGSVYGEDGHLAHNQTSGELSIKSSIEEWFYAVNDDLFGHEEAQVACFELYGVRSYVSMKAGVQCEHDTFWANDFICEGNEASIKECGHSYFSQMPDPTKDCVALICTEAGPELNTTGTLHLGSDKILAITYNGETKAVCEDGFTLKNAQVACLELTGLPDVLEYSGGHRCEYDSFWLDDVDCLGPETLLQDCGHLRWGQHNCNSANQCIQLACGTTPIPVVVVIHNPDTGVITLSVDTVEQGICDDSFGLENAQVICNQLYGDTDVLSVQQGQACPAAATDFWLDDVVCEGSEASLLDCSHNPLGVHNCRITTECVQVYCKAGGPQPLAHLTHNTDAILSITYIGETKALCHNGFTENSARVACLELYGTPDVVSYEINHECAYQEFWVDRVACTGTVEETRVQLCPNRGFGNAHCNPATDCIRLYCVGGGPQIQIINVVQNPTTAILSVTYTDVPKGLCQHAFDQQDAEVVCRQLYGRDAGVISFAHGQVCEYPEYWLSDLECEGDENNVADCDYLLPLGTSSCNSANQCVQLYCSAGPQPPTVVPPVLQQNGQGALSILYNNKTRDVCQQGFDANAATVACRELYNSSSYISFKLDQPCQYDDFWLDGLLCQGTEENLMACVHKDLGSHNCGPDQCVRLFCLGSGPAPIPIAETSTLMHGPDGILSIEYRDENRSICDDGFSQYAAQVACNQLYGDSHVLSYTQQEQCTYDGFWLDDVVCTGDESALQQCPHSQWGTHNCDSSNSCIKLYCLGGGPQPPSNTTETPEFTPQCIVLYSSCGYSGDSVSMCGDLDAALSEDELGWQVMCIKIPEDYQVRIFDKADDGSGEVDITESIPCLKPGDDAVQQVHVNRLDSNVQSVHIDRRLDSSVQSVDVDQILMSKMIQSKRLNKKPLSFAMKSRTITKTRLLRKNSR